MATERIKLFVDAHCFDKEFQGTQTFLRELYTQLLADYPDVDIYFGASNTKTIRSIFPDLPEANILPYKKRKFGLLRFLFDIPFYLKKHRFDFAHFQYIIPKKIPGCTYIVTLHDVIFKDFKKDFSFIYRLSRDILFGYSIRNAAIKTTVSVYSKERICHHYGICRTDVHVIPNAVNPAFVHSQDTKKEAAGLIKRKFGVENFILYTSRLEPRKNQLLLLEKYLKLGLDKQGIALVLIGLESIRTPALTKLIKQLSTEQKKLFFRFEELPQSDLVAFYRACRLFVYPSKAEGFGIPPLEAGVCGAPVLCSSSTAMHDFDFFKPYTFDSANERDFEQKLAHILNFPPTNSFSTGVAAQIQHRYNWQKSSHHFYSLLRANSYKQTEYEIEDSHFGYSRNP
ncbi:glycosyltransferase family 4 protein [Runella sp.]|uniref:glycosyltransferase family 4 protein n=1 Tax=Runella sp. TaxID=1960881 RepID=UPI003D11FA7C